MREILFRAWDGKRYSIGNPEYFDDSVNFRFHHFDINCEKPILEQFTGLHDSTKWEYLNDAERDEWIKSGHTKEDWKGRRIFEGDKIKLTQGIGTVEWSKTQARFVIWLPKSNKFVSLLSGTTYEVIGNIHDNPELLS